jgi:hypothetical protein
VSETYLSGKKDATVFDVYNIEITGTILFPPLITRYYYQVEKIFDGDDFQNDIPGSNNSLLSLSCLRDVVVYNLPNPFF